MNIKGSIGNIIFKKDCKVIKIQILLLSIRGCIMYVFWLLSKIFTMLN